MLRTRPRTGSASSLLAAPKEVEYRAMTSSAAAWAVAS